MANGGYLFRGKLPNIELLPKYLELLRGFRDNELFLRLTSKKENITFLLEESKNLDYMLSGIFFTETRNKPFDKSILDFVCEELIKYVESSGPEENPITVTAYSSLTWKTKGWCYFDLKKMGINTFLLQLLRHFDEKKRDTSNL